MPNNLDYSQYDNLTDAQLKALDTGASPVSTVEPSEQPKINYADYSNFTDQQLIDMAQPENPATTLQGYISQERAKPIQLPDMNPISMYQNLMGKLFPDQTLNAIQTALPIAGGIGGGLAGGIPGGALGTGLGELAKGEFEMVRGQTPATQEQQMKVLKTAGVSSLLDAMLGGAGVGIKNVYNASQPFRTAFVEKASPVISQTLTNILPEETIKLINSIKSGKDIFKNTLSNASEGVKGELDKLGSMFQNRRDILSQSAPAKVEILYKTANNLSDTLDKQREIYGKYVEDARKSVQESSSKNPEAYSIFINHSSTGEPTLGKRLTDVLSKYRDIAPTRDFNKATQIVRELSGKMDSNGSINVVKLDDFKTKIQNELNSLYTSQSLSKGGTGDMMLRDIISNIRNEVASKAPELGKANINYAKFKDNIDNIIDSDLKSESRNNLLKNWDVLSPEKQHALNELGKLTPQFGKESGSVYENIPKILQNYENSQLVKGALDKSVLKNPMNLLNKTPHELEILRQDKQIAPLMDKLDELRTRMEYEREFNFTKSPHTANRLDQESVIQQNALLSKILGVGGVLGGGTAGSAVGGLAGGALGMIGATIIQSPKLHAEVIKTLLGHPSDLIKGISGTTNTVIPHLINSLSSPQRKQLLDYLMSQPNLPSGTDRINSMMSDKELINSLGNIPTNDTIQTTGGGG